MSIAVKLGVRPGIYERWAECEAQTKGFSGAQYKAFARIEEAEKYIIGETSSDSEQNDLADQINSQVKFELSNLGENEVVAFVDGSFNAAEEKSGFGVIIIDHKGIQTPLYKAFTKQYSAEFLELRNVAAELEGVKEAIKWAIAYKKARIIIYHDYEGIGKWADGSWEAKKTITRQYATFLREKKALIDIEFCKVPAHSGIEYNEMADKLAKNSLLEKGYKTYNDGSIYFVGYSGDDWRTIIACINDENCNLKDNNKETVKIDVNAMGNRHGRYPSRFCRHRHTHRFRPLIELVHVGLVVLLQ